ncbi:broad specificity phosphatase PhoE [Saonia flava]|uniref:Broad specificity phosphatase PhoE n=1 Tax=Saonia flava TaxID=523696 RepID=A0A846QKV5_9FLAO|nr:phosphoglycerate mutase family protein [Saonia flava]NJB69576.1 broad specificity phosphatase PhoE [Saonia flava]
MKSVKFLLFSLLFIVFLNCKEDKEPVSAEEPVVSTFYFIRHAEKDRSDPENEDPELNQDGLGRAIRWAEVLDGVELTAIYTTDYERTSMTAAPAAVKKDITVQYYNPQDIDIEQFKIDNLGGNVLVVGHSNTTPEMVNKVIGTEKYEAMDDYDNGSLFIVRIIDGVPSDIRLQVN